LISRLFFENTRFLSVAYLIRQPFLKRLYLNEKRARNNTNAKRCEIFARKSLKTAFSRVYGLFLLVFLFCLFLYYPEFGIVNGVKNGVFIGCFTVL
jgi:hypothetical protein